MPIHHHLHERAHPHHHLRPPTQDLLHLVDRLHHQRTSGSTRRLSSADHLLILAKTNQSTTTSATQTHPLFHLALHQNHEVVAPYLQRPSRSFLMHHSRVPNPRRSKSLLVGASFHRQTPSCLIDLTTARTVSSFSKTNWTLSTSMPPILVLVSLPHPSSRTRLYLGAPGLNCHPSHSPSPLSPVQTKTPAPGPPILTSRPLTWERKNKT